MILPPLVFPVPAIYSFPVPRSAPLRATMIGTAFEHPHSFRLPTERSGTVMTMMGTPPRTLQFFP